MANFLVLPIHKNVMCADVPKKLHRQYIYVTTCLKLYYSHFGGELIPKDHSCGNGYHVHVHAGMVYAVY